MIIVLDSGPLGLLSNPMPRGSGNDAWEWARAHAAAGASIVLPEIADYEVRRELVRARRAAGLARLDEPCIGSAGFVDADTMARRDCLPFLRRR